MSLVTSSAAKWKGPSIRKKCIVVGGGAAGFFAAITCAEAKPGASVALFEQAPRFLGKVRISGGGRCNVTHACFDARALVSHYPRGGQELLGPFTRFQPRDTIAWFESRGVKLKTEADGRMFPVTDSSETIVDCLVAAAKRAGVELVAGIGVKDVARMDGGFEIQLTNGESRRCDGLLLATGGSRLAVGARLAAALGHTLEPAVPSLFTFTIETPWVRELAGVSVEDAGLAVAEAALKTSGALLFTHWGMSGPAVLRLSAWGARSLHAMGYRFIVRVNWVPEEIEHTVQRELAAQRARHPARTVYRTPCFSLPARLWERLTAAAGIVTETRWSGLTRTSAHALSRQLLQTELPVTSKSLNKDEFVTCGGVRLAEVNFKTMESRICPGLHLAGELLDVDGLTGGFNFQAAWTTGWIAGKAMAGI